MTYHEISYQSIFRRYELKYLVAREQKRSLLTAMEPYIEPDEYGRSLICSLYFDTPDFLLARRSLERPIYKEKLRLRSYGIAEEDSQVFVELKKKYQGVVYKRRVGAGQGEAMDYLCGDRERTLVSQDDRVDSDNQIIREIDYFKSLYRELSPAVYLSYEREAFCGVADCGLRITFDENILWRRKELSLCAKPYGSPLLEPGYALLEIKTANAVPMWLCRLLSEHCIFAGGFSKYGSAYRQIVENKKAEDNYGAEITARIATEIAAETAIGGRKYA